MNVTHPAPRTILVEFETSSDPSAIGQSFGPPYPAAWSVTGSIGRLEISAATHQEIRDDGFLPPVPGSFSPIVVEIDLGTLEATSQPTGGAFSNGTQSSSFSTRALESTAPAGFVGPEAPPLFCTSQQQVDDACPYFPILCGQVCTLVPGAPYQPSTGKINLVGSAEEGGCDGTACFGPFENFAATGDLRLQEEPPGVPASRERGRAVLALALLASAAWALHVRRGYPSSVGGKREGSPGCHRDRQRCARPGALMSSPHSNEATNQSANESADDSAVARLRRDGYVILREILTPGQVDAVRSELAPYLQGRLMGRNEFEGLRSERVYALLAKSPTMAELIEHPRVLGIVDQLLHPTYLLSAALAVNTHPGETAQAYHCDDAAARQPRPRPMFGVSVIWAIDAFTETNGATEMIPGSHLWEHDVPPEADVPDFVQILMPPGSAVVFAGSLYHRGGANRSHSTRLGITPQYCEPWLRQIENMVLAVPPEVARNYSVRVQELLGYSVAHPSFMGYVDGMHPRRLVDPAYAGVKAENAGVPEALRTRS